jgi:hypothetical protein
MKKQFTKLPSSYVKASWQEDVQPYGFDSKSLNEYDADDWAYYLASELDLSYDDYQDLLHDLEDLRGDEWARDYEAELTGLGCFNDFAKFTNYLQVFEYDTSLEPEIFEFLDECGGYSDYNQKVEDVAEEWKMSKDLAGSYVWNWSIQIRIPDEDENEDEE